MNLPRFLTCLLFKPDWLLTFYILFYSAVVESSLLLFSPEDGNETRVTVFLIQLHVGEQIPEHIMNKCNFVLGVMCDLTVSWLVSGADWATAWFQFYNNGYLKQNNTMAREHSIINTGLYWKVIQTFDLVKLTVFLSICVLFSRVKSQESRELT